MPSSFKEEDPGPEDEVEQNIIVIRSLSSESVTHLTSLPSYYHGQTNLLTSTPISLITTTTSFLPTQPFQGTPEDFSSLFFPTLTTLGSPSISLSSPPSYSDSLSSLAFHTPSDQPVSSLSYTLTSPAASSFSSSYPIYRPTPIYTYSRPSSFSVRSIPYLYSSVLSTNTLSPSYHGSSSTRVSSAFSGPGPCGPKRRATSSRTRDWLRSGPRDITYHTTRGQGLRPVTSGSSFHLLSSWANPSSYRDNPMNLTCYPKSNPQSSSGSSSNLLFRSDFCYPHIYSPMVTFNEPSENLRGMFSFVLSCEFSPGANNKLLLSSLIKR